MVKKTEPTAPQISSLANKADEKCIPTGIPELDEVMNGGIYRGRITEFWGAEGVGKTHIVTQIMANLSKDQTVLYIDSEFALNRDRVIELGADPNNIEYIADSHLEAVCELIVREVGNYDVIILDSLPYLTPLTVDSGQVGETSIGLFARLIKHWIVKFRPRLGASKTAFVAINQFRAPIGLYARTEPPGGKAYHHAVDVRLWLHTNAGDKIMNGTERVGHWVHVEVRKNKLGRPFQTTKFKISYLKEIKQQLKEGSE